MFRFFKKEEEKEQTLNRSKIIENSIETSFSLIAKKPAYILNKFEDRIIENKKNNLIKIKLEEATITCFLNIFDMCDINMLTFKDHYNYSLLQKYCDTNYQRINRKRWLEDTYSILYITNNMYDQHFLISWQNADYDILR